MTGRRAVRFFSHLLLVVAALSPSAAVSQHQTRESGEQARADRLEDIALKHYRLAQFDSALFYFGQALSIQREIHDRTREARTLNGMGLMHDRLGRLDSALVYYALSLPLVRAVGNRSGEATTLNNIGVVQDDLGRPDSALAFYLRALPIQRELRNHPAAARTLNNIGVLHQNLGRPDSALVYYGLALTLQHGAEDRRDEGITLGNIGAAHSKLGRPDSGLVYHTRALLIQRQSSDRSGEAITLYRLGWTEHARGRPDTALALYSLALSIQRDIKDRANEARTLDEMGVVHLGLGRVDSALSHHSLSLALRREVRDLAGEATTLRNIGVARLSVTDRGSALAAAATLDTAAATRARIRRRAGSDANAVSLGEANTDTFREWSRAWRRLATEAAAAGDDAARARAVLSSLAATERGRAQALRDLLDQNRGPDRAAPDAGDTLPGADLAAEGGKLLASLRSTRTALLYYLDDGDTLRTWFFGASGELQVLAPTRGSRANVADLMNTLRESIGAGEVVARRRRGDGNPSANGISARRDVLGSDLQGDLDPNASDQALSALAAAVLPQGLETLLLPGTELVIVPHGALGQLPFALFTLPGDTTPLGVRNPLRYTPSLRALVAAEATRDTAIPRRFLVVGNPLMPHVRDVAGRRRQLSSLPGAAAEGAWVAAKLGAPLLTGADATEEAVRSRLPGAAIVHLATHGLAFGTEARVRDSYVALSPGANHDGLLTLGELLEDDAIRLSAELIVLSACQTGLGEIRQAEGTVGLQRGLLAKGARSVLVSLWSVDDAATRLLMERFYTHWLDGNGEPKSTKAEALQRAQGDVRANPTFANPRYWGAFQLVGAR